jgi:phage major head subunit gpT-like protein|tara:strand:- start:611 stop:1516 length:906 start_codon:yes stop_codon:yes gene_type:complete
MTINTSSIQQLLRPGLAEVFGDYPMYPAEYTEIFTTQTSDKAVEIEVEMKLLGLASIKGEGAPTQFQDMGQRVISTYYHRYTSVGFIITRQAMKDNLYESQFPLQAQSLRNSMLQSKEVNGASVLNNGFSSSFPGGDGQPLFSTAHPIDTGTFANTPSVQVDLNESSLQDAIVTISQFRDQAGLITMTKPTKLIVPPQLQFTADRILHSQFRTGTANNDINAIYNIGAVPQGYRVNHFLTDTNGWFLMTDAPNGLKHYVREALETDVFTDFTSDNLLAKAIERYSFGWSNPRGSFGSSGAT